MALIARYLIDTSAAARMHTPLIAEVLGTVIDAGLAATTAVLDAEALYSARSPGEFAQVRSDRRAVFEYVPTTEEHWQAALDAQFRLAQVGRHRSVGIADMLTAVTAKANRLAILHYDSDFDTAAMVLDFEHRWVAEPGTL